ncbi:MAG: alternative oxidase [Bacillota bacterium]
MDIREHEALIEALNDPAQFEAYREPVDGYRPGIVPRLLGGLLVFFGNLVYGKRPSYLKFRSVEVIARVPYQSWVSAAYTMFTLFYSNERKALELSHTARFGRLAQDNETMHVVVISQLAKKYVRANPLIHTVIPMLFAFGYFWASYWLFLLNRRWSYELNYCFESHAFEQYSRFLEENEAALKSRPIESDFLTWYGRHPRTEYEFFRSVRNDELVHRNASIHQISAR